jgi:hypothetical protein
MLSMLARHYKFFREIPADAPKTGMHDIPLKRLSAGHARTWLRDGPQLCV